MQFWTEKVSCPSFFDDFAVYIKTFCYELAVRRLVVWRAKYLSKKYWTQWVQMMIMKCLGRTSRCPSWVWIHCGMCHIWYVPRAGWSDRPLDGCMRGSFQGKSHIHLFFGLWCILGNIGGISDRVWNCRQLSAKWRIHICGNGRSIVGIFPGLLKALRWQWRQFSWGRVMLGRDRPCNWEGLLKWSGSHPSDSRDKDWLQPGPAAMRKATTCFLYIYNRSYWAKFKQSTRESLPSFNNWAIIPSLRWSRRYQIP